MDVNGKDYRVLCLLGKGKGGYSYLVTDGERQYVLKQIHHEPCAYYQFGDKLAAELGDYERLRQVGIRLPLLLEADKAQERILKEYIAGPTIYELVSCDGVKPDYVEQLRTMCRKLYENDLNIDYFPTNFVVQDGLLYYVDYECNRYMERWDFDHWGILYWSKTEEFLRYAESHK